ncbi:glycosyltransferase [candidate division WWE3 bacterium]|nr:glycosyltransferase [candidate division WWE3 bacterium]
MSKIKVLMLGRIGLLEQGGGDKVQIENTAKELRKLGIEVDIATGLKTDISSYDLVHVFQLDWTPETYLYAKKVKEANKPLILSPIHHSVKEVIKFDETYAFDLRRLSKLLFRKQHARDTFKNVYRSFFDLRKFGPTAKSILVGLKKMHRKTLNLADTVLVQTNLEAFDLKDTYGVDFNWVKVPNGVGEQFLNLGDVEDPFEEEEIQDYLFCVGRIEPRKNQLNIIEAAKLMRAEFNKEIPLVFVGTKSTKRHFEYVWRFNRALKANPWIKHISRVPYEEIPAYFHFAKVGVSASWFETTGLTSLEALFCGTNAVAAGPRAKEYLGDKAFYCRPDDVTSIKDALVKAYKASPPKIDSAMKKEYTWKNAAKKTLEVYENSLK